jgi:hypothetical protein
LTQQRKGADTLGSPIDKLSTRITDRLPSVQCVREPNALTAFPHVGENIMPPNDDCPDNDSFERALSEYREESWCPYDFADLPTDVQCDIIERACHIQAANDRLNELVPAA